MRLDVAMREYENFRRARGKSKATIRNEQVVIGQLLAVVGPIQLHSLTIHHLDKLWDKHPEWSAATSNTKRAYLSSFFGWARQRGHMPKTHDPLEATEKRREPRREKTIIPQERWDDLLGACTKPRDRALIALGLYTFMRVSELKTVRWRDIDWSNKTINVWREKTQEFDVLPMCEELEEELRRWQLQYGSEAGQVPQPEWFVVPKYTSPQMVGLPGGGLKVTTESAIIPDSPMSNPTPNIKRVLDRAGYDAKQNGGHTLRRSGATALYHELSRVGHDRAVRLVGAMLGHSNIATTEKYLSLSLDMKARNDLLSGKRMFAKTEAQVVALEVVDGEENGRAV